MTSISLPDSISSKSSGRTATLRKQKRNSRTDDRTSIVPGPRFIEEVPPAIKYYYYLRVVLKHKTDLHYNMFGPVRPWDNNNDNTGENLRLAMTENPYMHLMFQSGYYDAKYTMWQLDPSSKMNDRLSFKGIAAGT